jgi:hypothetical protein
MVNNLEYSLLKREQINLSELESAKPLGIKADELDVICEVVKKYGCCLPYFITSAGRR